LNWTTRVTQLLGCRYPIIQGSYAGFGNSSLAAPVSEAGGFGLITASALKTPEKLREDIRRAKSVTAKPFGVNLTVGMTPNLEEMLEVAIEEKVQAVETSAFHSEHIGKRIKDAGIVWFHKVATVEHAVTAEKQGADAVVIVGLEGTGFKNVNQLPTLVAITWAARKIRIPIIAAGGIGDARGILGALAMGAEAAYMGTVFMATTECAISDRYKALLVSQMPTDRDVRDRALNPPDREELERVMKLRNSLPMDEWLRMLEKVNLKQSPSSQPPILESDEAFRVAGGSLAVAFIDEVVTVKELIDRIVGEAERIVQGWTFLKS